MRSRSPAVAAMSSSILNPAGDSLRRDFVEAVAAHHEKAGHGIAEIGCPPAVWVSLVASREIAPRLSEKLAALPPST